MRPRSTALGGLLVAALVLGACGSDPEQPVAPAPTTGSTSDTDVLGGCSAFAEQLCQSAEACCTSVYGSFSQAACVDGFVQSVCLPAAQLVAAGRATYDASAEAGCLAARKKAHDVCIADWQESVELRRELWMACRVVKGVVVPGGGCSTPLMCAPPDGVGTSACDHNVCREVRLLAEGEACPYPLGDVPVCDLGLYCTAQAQDEIGICVRATAEGESCDPVAQNQACGLGNYCDLDDGVCRHATNFGGPTCAQGTECVSFVCDGVSHVCSDPLPTAGDLCEAS